MQSAPPVARFSTEDVAPQDRIAIWRELIFQSSLEVDIAPADDGPFRATAAVRQLPGLRILSGTSPAATYRRAVQRVEADDMTLQFGASDDVLASLNRREAEIGSYDAFLWGSRLDQPAAKFAFHRTAAAARRDGAEC